MATFGSILDRPSTSIERPKPLPAGTYVCILKGLPKEGKAKTGTEFYEFAPEIVQPLEDVNADAIEAAGGVIGKTIPRCTFYLTEDAAWRLRAFFVNDLELDEGSKEDPKSLRQLASETMGKQLVCTVRHKPSDDGKSMYAEFGGSGPVSALAEADED